MAGAGVVAEGGAVGDGLGIACLAGAGVITLDGTAAAELGADKEGAALTGLVTTVGGGAVPTPGLRAEITLNTAATSEAKTIKMLTQCFTITFFTSCSVIIGFCGPKVIRLNSVCGFCSISVAWNSSSDNWRGLFRLYGCETFLLTLV